MNLLPGCLVLLALTHLPPGGRRLLFGFCAAALVCGIEPAILLIMLASAAVLHEASKHTQAQQGPPPDPPSG